MRHKICQKAINFDLDTKSLKKYYPGKDYRQAYKDIKYFLIKNGFTHRQWSGYVSKGKISMQRVNALTLSLNACFPWLEHCVRKFDVTDVGRQYDLTHLFTGNNLVRNMDKKKEKTQEKSFTALTDTEHLKDDARKKKSKGKDSPDKDKSNDKSKKKPKNKDDLGL